jgi:hypothetical protein
VRAHRTAQTPPRSPVVDRAERGGKLLDRLRTTEFTALDPASYSEVRSTIFLLTPVGVSTGFGATMWCDVAAENREWETISAQQGTRTLETSSVF